MAKVSLLNRLGNAYAALFGTYGAVTAQAEQAGCSRQSVYDHAEQVQQAIAEAQLPGPSRAELLAENRRLRAQLQQRAEQLTPARHQAADAIAFAPAQPLRLALLTLAIGPS